MRVVDSEVKEEEVEVESPHGGYPPFCINTSSCGHCAPNDTRLDLLPSDGRSNVSSQREEEGIECVVDKWAKWRATCQEKMGRCVDALCVGHASPLSYPFLLI